MQDLEAWIGRRETRRDRLTAAPLQALAATLDAEPAPVPDGTPLAHWLYFLPLHRASAIGPD